MKRQKVQNKDTYVLDFSVFCACGNHAVHFLEIHAVNFCTPEDPTRSALVCDACLARDVQRIEQILADGEGFCRGCSLPIVTVGDMIIKQYRINEGK